MPTLRRRKRSLNHQRGIALIWTLLSLMTIVLGAAFVIDMGWLYFQRQHAQNTADAAALAGDWALMKGYTDDEANALATQVLANNGYTAGGTNAPTFVLTPGPNSVSSEYMVSLTSPEPLFFDYVTSMTGMKNVMASATATFNSVPPISGYSPAFYGQAGGNSIALVAYGPDQGATRGDAVNTRWNDITGEYAKVPNPQNYNSQTGLPLDTGETFLITPATNYSTLNPVGDSMMSVQIFDPQTSVSTWDTTAMDQYVTTSGATSTSGSLTPDEKWTYTLTATTTTGETTTTTTVASATYGETDTALEANWVTPKGFTINLNNYTLADTTFQLNVKTDNPYEAGVNNALDKNGYQVRVGPNFDETSSAPTGTGTTTTAGITYDKTYASAFTTTTDSNGSSDIIQYPGSANGVPLNPSDPSKFSSTPLPDSEWNTLAVPNGTPVAAIAAEDYLPVTAFESGQGEVSFGYLGANPNVTQPSLITFNGFDEDSGATGITYKVSAPGQPYDGTVFTGVLGWQSKDNSGNGIWSSPGLQTRGVSEATTPSNTVYFPPGVYQGGTWTAYYTTGKEDTATFDWSVNWAGQPGNNNNLRLISTTYSDY